MGQFGRFARLPNWERGRPARNEREARKSVHLELKVGLRCGRDARGPSEELV